MKADQTIGLVAIVVPDYDEAIRFYRDALGFELVEDTAQSKTKRWVVVRPKNSGATGLLLAKADGPEQEKAIGNQTGGRVGFFLETTDFARDHRHMLASGVAFEEDPRNEPYGIVAVFRDPFGNRWDIIQRK